MEEYHIALTGHRPQKLAGYDRNHPFYQRLRQLLMGIIEDYLGKYDKVICHSGMALGADTIWAEAIANMRYRYRQNQRVELIAHIPCNNQEARWSPADQDHYHDVLSYADREIIYSDKYTPICMQQRNIGMIRECNLLIAIWDGSKGGTANCVEAGREQCVSILQLEPSNI